MARKEGKEYPTVFISYSYDSPEHAEKVLAFSDKLRSEGIDAILDQYEESPPEGWSMWMERQIRAADFVLMICTRTYYKRVMGKEGRREGLGVKWEGNLIYHHIYNADTRNTKFIPVLFAGSKTEYIPTPLRGATYYRVETIQDYEDLYRRLTNQPKTIKPKLGKHKELPSRRRKQDTPKKILRDYSGDYSKLAMAPPGETREAEMEPPFLPKIDAADIESEIHEAAMEPEIHELAVGPPPAKIRKIDTEPLSEKEHEFRQLQAQVFDNRSNEKVTFFKPDSPYLVKIRIGFSDPAWLETSFPENLLPPSPTGHNLTVVFVEPNHHPEPSIGHIHLPPRGNSTICDFHFRTKADAKNVSARILVLFKNRVLSSLLLEGAVVLEPTSDSAITFQFHPEITVNPLYSNLNKQKPFDGAIVINHTTAGTPQALKFVDGKAELVSLQGLDVSIKNIDIRLSECDWTAPEYKDLESTGTVELLRFLACHGSLLYGAVVKDQFINQQLVQAKRLQVIAAKPEARLPVEFFYDSPSPSDTAKLCPNCTEALKSGKCEACPGKSHENICLLAFWGLSRVIEWHRYKPEAKTVLTNSDFAFHQQLDSLRQKLRPLRSALFGASEKVDKVNKGSSAKVETELKKVTGNAFTVKKWPDWTTSIEKNSPSLLLLIPHTDKNRYDIVTLQIGKDQISVDQIDENYVRPTETSVLPVVFLLGCSTGASDISFEGAVTQFRRYGASIVVSTTTGILGRHASLVAIEFLKKIKEFSESPSHTFGEVVLSVRRELLLQGVPVALAVVSYGDADWRLGD